MIIDISHHQAPSKMDYDKLAKQVKLVIIRTQYGSKTLDKHYKTHHKEFQKRGIPTACYAWIRGISINDMRTGVSAYADQLRKLGAKKVGAYIGHHFYKQFNLDTNDFDAIWIPRYGSNNGIPQTKPAYPCDLWQYTDKGRLDGYPGNLDLNRLTGSKPLSYFIGEDRKEEVKNEPDIDIPSTWAKEDWEWGVKNRITDGSNPKKAATREEVVSMIRKSREVK